MADVIQQYIDEWNRRNPNDPFANLVKGELINRLNSVRLYVPVYVGGVLKKQNLMDTLSTKGITFFSVENALKNFFQDFPKYSRYYTTFHKVDPLAPIQTAPVYDNEAITFEEVLRSADENGFHIPRNYILVDQKPDILPNTPPPTTTEKPKIGIGWILLGIAVGGIVLYKIAKK